MGVGSLEAEGGSNATSANLRPSWSLVGLTMSGYGSGLGSSGKA